MSAFCGNLDCAKFIYEKDPRQIAAKTVKGCTPLHSSCSTCREISIFNKTHQSFNRKKCVVCTVVCNNVWSFTLFNLFGQNKIVVFYPVGALGQLFCIDGMSGPQIVPVASRKAAIVAY